jgi:plastocyanin
MNLRRWTLVAPMVMLVLAPAGVLAEVYEVQMTTVDFEPQFVPSELTIRPGDSVRWTNTDPFLDHSTMSGTGSADPAAGELWDSGILRLGQWFEYTFDETGSFEYFSVPNEVEGMFGVVNVRNGTDNEPEIVVTTWGAIKAGFREFLPRD